MAAAAGLDARLAPFIAGYVLVLAVVGPIMAGRAHWLALALQAAEGMLSARRAANAPCPVRRPDQAALDPERQPVSGRV
jgi:monovalent cation:H+ antiporter-2, CPA2 family